MIALLNYTYNIRKNNNECTAFQIKTILSFFSET